MTEEFYEDKIDCEGENVIIEDEDDDEEIVYDESDTYKDDYEYDQIIGKRQKILSKLNKVELSDDEMDEIFNIAGRE